MRWRDLLPGLPRKIPDYLTLDSLVLTPFKTRSKTIVSFPSRQALWVGQFPRASPVFPIREVSASKLA